jgi:sarcosine oxidase subunit gamma
MHEHAQKRVGLGNTPVVQVTSTSGRTILRLQSWSPRHMQDKPVLLAGRELPSQVGAMLSGSTQVLCVGPHEWLLVSQGCDASSLREPLYPNLAAQGLVLVELTDGLTIIEVRGPAAPDLLTKGCGLDLHPRRFPAGRCARTRFAQILLTVVCLDEPRRFELYVARSYAHYLHSWLIDAAAEFADGFSMKPCTVRGPTL